MNNEHDLEERLREIVLRHTTIGGYPDTMAIARAAYAMDRPKKIDMSLERSVWKNGVSQIEKQDLANWIVTAEHDVLNDLVSRDLNVTDPTDQTVLANVWREAANTTQPAMMQFEEDNSNTTYLWSDGERRALRKAIETLRPGYFDADPGQGMLL